MPRVCWVEHDYSRAQRVKMNGVRVAEKVKGTLKVKGQSGCSDTDRRLTTQATD